MTGKDKTGSPDPIAGIAPLDLRNAFDVLPPPIDSVLPGMPVQTIGALVSQGGTGKSFVAAEIATAVAGGPDILEIGVKTHGKVVMLPAEDPRVALMHRFHAIAEHLDDDARNVVAENLSVLPLMGHQVNIGTSMWADAVERVATGARLVVVDTLRRFHIEDENASGAMSQLLGIMEGICERSGASILFLHHTAKGAALNGASAEQQASRGSSVLVDNIRGGQWNLMGMSEAEQKRFKVDERKMFVKLTQSKANFGAPTPDKWLERSNGGVLIPSITLETANDVRTDADQKIIQHPSAPLKKEWRREDG